MTQYIRATWDVAPDFKIYIEAVHCLSNLGAVVTHRAVGPRKRASRRSGAKSPSGQWKATVQSHRIVRRDQPRRRARAVRGTAPADTAAGKCGQPSARALFCATSPPATGMRSAKVLADDMFPDDRRRVETRGADAVEMPRSQTCGRLPTSEPRYIDVGRHRDPRGAPHPARASGGGRATPGRF